MTYALGLEVPFLVTDSCGLHWVITLGNLMPKKILLSVFQMNPLGLGKTLSRLCD